MALPLLAPTKVRSHREAPAVVGTSVFVKTTPDKTAGQAEGIKNEVIFAFLRDFVTLFEVSERYLISKRTVSA